MLTTDVTLCDASGGTTTVHTAPNTHDILRAYASATGNNPLRCALIDTCTGLRLPDTCTTETPTQTKTTEGDNNPAPFLVLHDMPFQPRDNSALRVAVRQWLVHTAPAEAKYGHISGWDTSRITNMSRLFENAHFFNEPLNDWDVSNVTKMCAMFQFAAKFDQPLYQWDVSKVTDMSKMFHYAEAFNQPLHTWNVSQVTDTTRMFDCASAFDQPLNNWDVSRTNRERMFHHCYYTR